MAIAGTDLAPATLFLVLYLSFAIFLVVLYAQKKISWRSRYSFIFFHVILRIGGQICGIGFSVTGWDHFNSRLNWLVAYLVMSAEGYFSLVLCAYRFLITWQNDRFGTSVLEPRIPKGTSFSERQRIILHSRMGLVHWALIAANSIIIAGGSMLSGAMSKPAGTAQDSIRTGKALRVAGTAIFLGLVQIFLFYAVVSYRKKGDRTLTLIILTWPWLTIRGAFGIVSVVVNKFSYYNFAIYNGNGIAGSFLAGEYVLGTAMEWLACAFLLSTYFSRVTGGETVKEEYEKSQDEESLPATELSGAQKPAKE